MRTFLLLTLLAVLAACSDSRNRGPGGGEHPLVFIGIDGAEWDVINALIEQGDLPNLKRLRNGGAWGHLINTGPLSSPVAWTTFATGRFGRDHGIMDFVYPYRGSGAKRPVNATDKTAPSIWNVASDHGVTVAVLGYFVTHPAEPVRGVMISDRASQYLENAYYPADYLADPHAAVNRFRMGEGHQELLDRFFPWYREDGDWAEGTPEAKAAGLLESSPILPILSRDAFIHDQTLQVMEAQPDLTVTYFRIPDVIGHTLWKFHDPASFDAVDPELVDLLGGAVIESYRLVDEYVGSVIRHSEPGTNFVIVSDHGMGPATGHFAPRRDRGRPITGDHRPDGIMLAAGPSITSGQVVGMTALDVAPTLLALAGLPISDELPGTVESNLIKPQHFDVMPLRTTGRYEHQPGEVSVEIERQAEQDTMETLRGLGYIGNEVDLADEQAADSGDGTVFWQLPARLFAGAFSGEMIYYILVGNDSAAQALWDALVENRPDRVAFMTRQLRKRIRTILREAPLDKTHSARLWRFLKQQDLGDQ